MRPAGIFPLPEGCRRGERNGLSERKRGESLKTSVGVFSLWHKPGEYLWMSIIFVYFQIITAWYQRSWKNRKRVRQGTAKKIIPAERGTNPRT